MPSFVEPYRSLPNEGFRSGKLVTEAVKEKLAQNRGPSDQPWMTAFGKLRRLRKETARINRIIREEFEPVEAEDRL